MIVRDISLRRYGWSVICFIGYRPCDCERICSELREIGCGEKALDEAYIHLSKGSGDRGLTYSNIGDRKSIVAVGLSDDEGSIVNTIGHELLHVVAHICEEEKIDMLGEEPCYMMGSLCESVFKSIEYQ